MKINALDFGGSHPWPAPQHSQNKGEAFVEGLSGFAYARGGAPPGYPGKFFARSAVAIGGNAAGSPAALRYLLHQLLELARNADAQPVYIQWFATDEAGAYSASSQYDGWYLLESVQYDERQYVLSGGCWVQMSVTRQGPAVIRRVGQLLVGGALSSAYTGTALPWAAFPVNSTPAITTISRTGSEGMVPIWISPAVNPAPFVMPATISDTFKGGCHVYDTLTVGGNAVPTSGLATNANWVEVFGRDHVFAGDIILLNGLQLLRFQTGVASTIATVWLWNTQLGTPAWQQCATLQYQDNPDNSGVLRQISLERVSLDEVQIRAVGWTSAGNEAVEFIRLLRGARSPRIEFRPQSQANTSLYGVRLLLVSAAKLFYNSVSGIDAAMIVSSPSATSDYGYGVSLILNSSFPYLAGFFWQSPAANQPAVSSTTIMGVGDNSGPGQNIARQYGFFAVPFPTPQNLQAEAEGGTLAGGTLAVTDVGKFASPSDAGNNAAKIPNTTVIGATGIFGTAWQPPAGNYRVRFRMRAGAATSGVSQFKYGLYNSTDSSYVQSATIAPNALTTTYLVYSPGNAIAAPTAKNLRFRFENTATMTDDIYVDEAWLEPVTSSSSQDFPQDLWQQFAYDCRIHLSLA